MIRNQIEAVVATLTATCTFMYGTAKEINEAADRIAQDATVVALYPLNPVNITLGKNASASTEFDLYMEFQFQTKFEQNSSDNETIVDQMLKISLQFLVAMEAYIQAGDSTRYFQFPKGAKQKALPIYYNKDKNMTGVSLTFTVGTRQDEYLLNC